MHSVRKRDANTPKETYIPQKRPTDFREICGVVLLAHLPLQLVRCCRDISKEPKTRQNATRIHQKRRKYIKRDPPKRPTNFEICCAVLLAHLPQQLLHCCRNLSKETYIHQRDPQTLSMDSLDICCVVLLAHLLQRLLRCCGMQKRRIYIKRDLQKRPTDSREICGVAFRNSHNDFCFDAVPKRPKSQKRRIYIKRDLQKRPTDSREI